MEIETVRLNGTTHTKDLISLDKAIEMYAHIHYNSFLSLDILGYLDYSRGYLAFQPVTVGGMYLKKKV